MDVQILAFVALGLLAYGAVSGRLDRSPITPPMAFVALGLGLGPMGLGILDIDIEHPLFHLLAELTLVIVLFTDASRINVRQLVQEHAIPFRMLAIGLPLTILLGIAVAMGLFPSLTVWQAAVIAAVLAPTDAALGQAVVSNARVPLRIRQSLNVESGLNDGIALPAVVILLSCLGHHENTMGNDFFWTLFTAKQVVLGPLVGAAVGYFGGKLVAHASRSGSMNHVFQELSAIALSLGAFSWAELVGGNGFIAAFIAGLVLGNTTVGLCECLYEFGEAEGQLMTLLVFLIFGAVMAPLALAHFSVEVVLYALASLTVVRMLPVFLSLMGLGLRVDTRVFLGWFGPRGIASILFGLLLLEEADSAQGEMMLLIVVTTVLASVVLHGLSAYPGAVAYADRLEDTHAEEEHQMVPAMPLRIRDQA